MSCVCCMAFLCGSTLVKVPLLQTSTVAIWPQMYKSDVKPKQTKVIPIWQTHHQVIHLTMFDNYWLTIDFHTPILCWMILKVKVCHYRYLPQLLQYSWRIYSGKVEHEARYGDGELHQLIKILLLRFSVNQRYDQYVVTMKIIICNINKLSSWVYTCMYYVFRQIIAWQYCKIDVTIHTIQTCRPVICYNIITHYVNLRNPMRIFSAWLFLSKLYNDNW